MQLPLFLFGDRLNVIQQTPATQTITHHKYLHGEGQNYKSIDCWGNVNNLLGKVSTGLQFKLLGHSGVASDHSEGIRIGVVGYKLELLIMHSTAEGNIINKVWNSDQQFCHSIPAHTP